MAAKMMAVKDLTVGSILADTVISVNGKVLFGKDIALTSRHISLLNTWDVQSVFIHVDEEQPADEPIQETAPQINSKIDSKEYFKFVQEYDSMVTNTAQTFDFIRKQKIVPVSHLKDTAANIHSSLANSFEIMNYLLVSDYKVADFISRHSVIVAYFAGIIARQMKWNDDDITGVALASLLHDVGNLVADKVDDPRAHANIAEAARLLRGTRGLSNEVILGIIQHREQVNNRKIFTGINGGKIHPYAKIVAVADFFHNLAYTNEYANPFPVLDMLTSEMFNKLDPDVCQIFINRVKDSLLNSKVYLSNGKKAEIIFFNPTKYSLPIVRIEDSEIVDLSQHKGLTISRISVPN